MKIFNFLLSGIILSTIFFSCSNSTKYSIEIKKLDSTLLALDTCIQNYSAIDTVKILNQLNEIKQDLKICEENIKDTLSFETAAILSEYRTSSKPFRLILEQYSSYSNDLTKSKKQIINLIHDFKIDKVEESKVAGYVQQELMTASNAVHLSNISIDLAKLYSEKFEIYKPKVNAFINTFK